LPESTIGKYLQIWLENQDWEVYPEAQTKIRGPRSDIIATKRGLLWAIEIKVNISLQLLEQAVRWIEKGAVEVSICVPYIARKKAGRRNWHSRVVDEMLRHYGIGLIFAMPDNSFMQAMPPKLLRFNYARSEIIKTQLDVRMKKYTPGSTSKMGYSTPRARISEDCIAYINKNPGCTLPELVKVVATPFTRNIKKKKYILQILEKMTNIRIKADRLKYQFYPINE